MKKINVTWHILWSIICTICDPLEPPMTQFFSTNHHKNSSSLDIDQNASYALYLSTAHFMVWWHLTTTINMFISMSRFQSCLPFFNKSKWVSQILSHIWYFFLKTLHLIKLRGNSRTLPTLMDKDFDSLDFKTILQPALPFGGSNWPANVHRVSLLTFSHIF